MWLRLKSVSLDLCRLARVEEMEVGLAVGLIWIRTLSVSPQAEWVLQFGTSLQFPPYSQVLQAQSCQGHPLTAVVQPEALFSPEAWSQAPPQASTPASVDELPKPKYLVKKSTL